MAKINITVDDRLLERADNFADENYMSRSGLFSLALTNYLNTADCITAIRKISLCMEKIADTGTIDEESKKQLEDFERLSNLLVKGME